MDALYATFYRITYEPQNLVHGKRSSFSKRLGPAVEVSTADRPSVELGPDSRGNARPAGSAAGPPHKSAHKPDVGGVVSSASGPGLILA